MRGNSINIIRRDGTVGAPGPPEERPNIRLIGAAGLDDEQIGPHALYALRNLLLRPPADSDHQHNRCNTNHDAKHREPGPELVAPDGIECAADIFEEEHERAITYEPSRQEYGSCVRHTPRYHARASPSQ